MDPLQQLPDEQLRTRHAEERLRTFPTDRWVALAIVAFAAIVWGANFGPVWLPVAFAVLGFIATMGTIWDAARGLFAKLKQWECEKE